MKSLKIAQKNICNGFCRTHRSLYMWTHGKLNSCAYSFWQGKQMCRESSSHVNIYFTKSEREFYSIFAFIYSFIHSVNAYGAWS